MQTDRSEVKALEQARALIDARFQTVVWSTGNGSQHAALTFPVYRGDGTIELVLLDVVFGPQFPRDEPYCHEIGGRWSPSVERHMYADGRFCLRLPTLPPFDCSTVDGLNSWFADLAEYLNEQFIFDSIGRYPGEQWAHSLPAAFAQQLIGLMRFVPEARQGGIWDAARLGADLAGECPCLSGSPVEQCHGGLVRELRDLLRTMRHEHGDVTHGIDLGNLNHHQLEKWSRS